MIEAELQKVKRRCQELQDRRRGGKLILTTTGSASNANGGELQPRRGRVVELLP